MSKMNRTLYTLFFYLLLPFILLRLYFRGSKAPAYRQRWQERLGFYKQPVKSGVLWVHAVSVGETLAIVPLVKLIQQRHPDLQIVMTTMTPTGAERVEAAFADSVQHLYCPYDIPCALGRFLAKVKPIGCIVVETELWPNMINACYQRQIPLLVANARLSARSAAGYAKFGRLSRQMLQQIDLIAAQNSVDGARFTQLGLPDKALQVTGSIKFDITAPEGSERLAAALKQLWGQQRPVIIAASTHEGEESILLEQFKLLQKDLPELLLIIVPRHPERFDRVAELITDNGLNFARRSIGDQPDQNTQVYLGDTMGELMKLIAAADIAFVGGSLIERGGHNPLEPALLNKPVLMGPHYFNFLQICEALKEAGGLSVVESGDDLYLELSALLTDQNRCEQQGKAGGCFVKQNQGALERLYALVETTIIQH